MALDRTALRDALLLAFQQGLDDPDWTQEDAAEALANAIDTYVRGAEVVDVTIDVVDAGMNPIGTGTQSGPGQLN